MGLETNDFDEDAETVALFDECVVVVVCFVSGLKVVT